MAQEIADSKLIDTWSSDGLKVKPDISKIIEGWQLGEQPPHEYMNWLQNTFGSKLNHILKNGVASWNNETEYLAGSSVQHNGNIWLCKTTNTNSEPDDVNANWKRIITIEALTTVLGGYVALADFIGASQNLSGNGYQKIPGGLILQWGTKQINNTAINTLFTTNVTFPISFPNAPFRVLSTPSNTGTAYLNVSSETATTTGYKIVSSSGTTGLMNVSFIAIGY